MKRNKIDEEDVSSDEVEEISTPQQPQTTAQHPTILSPNNKRTLADKPTAEKHVSSKLSRFELSSSQESSQVNLLVN